MKSRDIAIIGTMSMLAAMISYVEVIITPIVPIPGMRLGLSNIVLLICLIHLPLNQTLIITTLKSVLAAIFSGSITSFFYSFPSGIVSILIMYFMLKFVPKFSYIGVSVVGAFFNNIVQILVSYIVLDSFVYFYYMPYITIVGTIMGTIIGYIINELERKKVLNRFL